MRTLPPRAEVIVVGGGIVGLSIALALAEAGAKPLVLEAKSFGGAVTGGSLAAIGSHMHGLTEFALMRFACDLWQIFAETNDTSIEYNRQGLLGFILDQQALENGERWVRDERALGSECRMLTSAEVPEIEPRLTGTVVGATFAPDTATVNPFLAARAILRRARATGAQLFEHAPVAKLTITGGRISGVRLTTGEEIVASTVVLASGPWSQEIAASIGIDLPLVPRQAQCLASLRQPLGTLRCVISAVEGKGGVDSGYTQIQQSASGQILFNTVTMLTKTHARAKDTIREVPPSFVVSSIDMLGRLFPSLANVELLRSWVRFEAVTPDARFLAGRTGPEGLWICAGDNGSGYCRALMLGRFMANEITGRNLLDPTLNEDARRLYDPARFGRLAA